MSKENNSVITEKTDNTEKTEKKDRFKVLRVIKNVILGTLIAFLTLVLIMSILSRVNGSSPALFGYSLYRVSSGSMAPELGVGDVILVHGCDGKDVKKDDIVTYVATSGEMSGKLITHRVVEAPYQQGSEYFLVTKGDANEVEDDPVNTNQIEGKMAAKIGILKFLFDFFVTPWGLLAIIALIILAFSNEIIILVKAIFGIGYHENESSVEEIIERYQRENLEKNKQNLPERSDKAQGTTEEAEEK